MLYKHKKLGSCQPVVQVGKLQLKLVLLCQEFLPTICWPQFSFMLWSCFEQKGKASHASFAADALWLFHVMRVRAIISQVLDWLTQQLTSASQWLGISHAIFEAWLISVWLADKSPQEQVSHINAQYSADCWIVAGGPWIAVSRTNKTFSINWLQDAVSLVDYSTLGFLFRAWP